MIPIHEPGLADVVARNRAAGPLVFSTDMAASVAHEQVQFIAVARHRMTTDPPI